MIENKSKRAKSMIFNELTNVEVNFKRFGKSVENLKPELEKRKKGSLTGEWRGYFAEKLKNLKSQ